MAQPNQFNNEDVNWDQPLPFYPSAQYITKNLAPEKSLTYMDVSALAKARKIAEQNGVLSPDLGEHLLPMAMVEGRSGNFGIRKDTSFYAKPSTISRFSKMGLSITDMTDPKEIAAREWSGWERDPGTGEKQWFKETPAKTPGPFGPFKVRNKINPPPDLGDIVIHRNADGVKMISLPLQFMEKYNPEKYAKTMAAILSEKASLTNGSPEQAVKRYNGQGKAIEIDEDKAIPADVNTYWNKVNAAKFMLSQPHNSPIVNHFNRTYNAK